MSVPNAYLYKRNTVYAHVINNLKRTTGLSSCMIINQSTSVFYHEKVNMTPLNLKMFSIYSILIFSVLILNSIGAFRRRTEIANCPRVHTSRVFDLEQIQGSWYVIKYYASSEESEIYRCMRTIFSLSTDIPEISMNFTFTFKDDPDNEHLYGNITWRIPDLQRPSHWVHSEYTYEGIYNTYVLDIDVNGDKSWVLLLHCAEKHGSPRYLSSFIMSRKSTLPVNVIAFLRDKLPRYDVDLQYLFDMDQHDCSMSHVPQFYQAIKNMKHPHATKHPMKHPQH